MTDPLWLTLNKDLIVSFLTNMWPRDRLEALCRAGEVEPRRLISYEEDYATFASDVVDEMVRIGKVIPFVGRLGEECAIWLAAKMTPPATIFISHTKRRSVDADLARNLRDDLVSAGYGVWLDEDEIVVGDSIPESISAGLAASDHFVMILSTAYMASPWVKREVWSVVAKMIRDSSIRILPCLAEECELPVFLGDLRYADFRADYRSGLNDVLRSVGAVPR